MDIDERFEATYLRNGLCRCSLPVEFKEIGYWEGCSLEGQTHTDFAINRCMGCGLLYGFPEYNFWLAIEQGTKTTKEKLAEIVIDNLREADRQVKGEKRRLK